MQKDLLENSQRSFSELEIETFLKSSQKIDVRYFLGQLRDANPYNHLNPHIWYGFEVLNGLERYIFNK